MDRIINLEGTPHEIGLAVGRLFGKSLDDNIEYYLRNRPFRPEDLDEVRLQSEAMP